MENFEDFNLTSALQNALADNGFETPTPIQSGSYKPALAGKDLVGIAQTGTGKTLAYMLPILQGLKFSKQVNPRVVVLVPTRELSIQVVENINSLTAFMDARALAIYGGVNINTQKIKVDEGWDIIVATPGRFYDLVLARSIQLKDARKVVIDEVDVMLDLGFRHQLVSIFELLPDRRQNLMYSATMTEEVDALIDDFFVQPTRISVAASGTRLDNISQQSYSVPNFYSKANLLRYLLSDREAFSKVIVFVATKKNADLLFELLEEAYVEEMCIIHSNKSQNYRERSMNQFDEGMNRILIATDVMARGLDFDQVSHVINMDTPSFPENYMHRIGRTGRAEKEGRSIVFSTPAEQEYKEAIETLMNYTIPEVPLPEVVDLSEQLLPEERDRPKPASKNRNTAVEDKNSAFHEKSLKNQKVNLGGKYRREIGTKFKKPKTKGNKPAKRHRR
jgi:ATP-dependent RNA helicase RhlE